METGIEYDGEKVRDSFYSFCIYFFIEYVYIRFNVKGIQAAMKIEFL